MDDTCHSDETLSHAMECMIPHAMDCIRGRGRETDDVARAVSRLMTWQEDEAGVASQPTWQEGRDIRRGRGPTRDRGRKQEKKPESGGRKSGSEGKEEAGGPWDPVGPVSRVSRCHAYSRPAHLRPPGDIETGMATHGLRVSLTRQK